MKHALALSFSMLALMACSGATPTPDSLPAAEDPAVVFDAAAMDALLSRAVARGEQIGVSALVFDEGKIVYTGAFGLRDRERDMPIELDTVFRIYSMTKPVTSAVILDLQEDGLLDLGDPVSKYIPELANMQVISKGEDSAPIFTPQETAMTIKDLLLHRAGIGYGIFGDVNPVETMYGQAGLFDPSETLAVKMTKLSKLPLLSQPGEGWYYSFSIDVLGRIAEVVTDKPLGEIMSARIFEPLGMTETGFFVRPDQRARFASNYQQAANGTYSLQEDGQTSGFLQQNAFESGGGGLVSTLGDYAKFAQMLLDGGIYDGHRVLDEATVKMMMMDQMDPDDKFMMPWFGQPGDAGFGYGGRVVTGGTPETIAKNGEAPGQFGWSGMARTNFWIDAPNDAFGIIMLQYFTANDPKIHSDFRVLTYQQTKNDK